jgi:hypothetical protein
LPIRRTWSASVCGASVRRRRALRRSDPRPPFRAPRAAPGTAGPIECTPFIVRHASTVRRLNGGHDRSDASLEVLVPSALACHAARVPGAATRTGDPASTVDRLHTPPPSPLMPCRHRSPTRGGVRSVLAVFRVVGVGPIDSARIDAARFDRDAPPFGASLHRARLRRGSCAGAFLRPAFRYPRGGSRGLVGPLSASRSFMVFRPVNVAGTKPVACHACDGIAFDAFSRRRSWGFQIWPLAGLLPQAGEARAFPRPRTHVPFAHASVAVF